MYRVVLLQLYFLCFLSAKKLHSVKRTNHENYVRIFKDSDEKILFQKRSPPEDVNSFFARFWEDKLALEPQFATEVGVHKYNDKLTSLTPNHYQNLFLLLALDVSYANMVLFMDPSNPARSNLQIFVDQYGAQMGTLMAGIQYFSVSFMEGPHIDMPTLLDHPRKSSKDYKDLISRYNQFQNQADEIIQLLDEGIQKNLTHHAIALKNLEKIFLSFAAPVEKNLFYEPFAERPDFVPEEEWNEIQDAAKEAIEQSISVGFRNLVEYIKNTYMKNTRPEIGARTLPSGQNFYQAMLQAHTTMEVTAQEVHQMGLSEVQRIKQEMTSVIKSLGQEISLQDFNQQLRDDPRFQFNSAEEALEACKDMFLNKIQPKLQEFFKNIPSAPLSIKPSPEQMQGGPKGYYVPGSPDGTVNGTFYLDTSSLNKLAKYEVTTLVLHEGLPGHHLQISYAMAQKGLPEFRKHYQPNVNTAYLEGWGLYSEYLGEEMGLYVDPYDKYGRLSAEIFRACRLVVDTGIHSLGWTRERAVDYMLLNTANSKSDIEGEVDRYIAIPGQACAYKFGEIKIKELRRRAEDALGEKFDIKEFHDVILRNSGPLSFIEQQVNQMIAEASS